MRHRKYLYQGVFKTASEMAEIFRMSPNNFRNKIYSGWRVIDGELVAPASRIRNKCWVKDAYVTKREYRNLQESFLGDSETAESLYC